MPAYKDITGQKFNRLTAIRDTGRQSGHGRVWEFLCDCGNTHFSKQDHVTSGRTTQCKECTIKSRASRAIYNGRYLFSTTHGMSDSKEYQSWDCAIQRCTNPNATGYSDYGGSGVCFHEEWRYSFQQFIDYMGMMPKDGKKYTLGRIDNDLGYIPGNVRWETDKQQAHNKGMVKRNTSGVTGVQVWNKNGLEYCVATWYNMEGKQRYKLFSVNKWGFTEAFNKAVEARAYAIECLNLCGAEYSEKHGL